MMWWWWWLLLTFTGMWTVFKMVFVWKWVWCLTGTWIRILIESNRKEKEGMKLKNNFKVKLFYFFICYLEELAKVSSAKNVTKIIVTAIQEKICNTYMRYMSFSNPNFLPFMLKTYSNYVGMDWIQTVFICIYFLQNCCLHFESILFYLIKTPFSHYSLSMGSNQKVFSQCICSLALP